MKYILSLFIFIYSNLLFAEISVGAHHYPPYSMKHNDTYVGLIAESFEKIMSNSKIKYNIETYPLYRGLILLKQGKLDSFFPVIDFRSKKELQKEDIEYLGPVANPKLTIFALKNRKLKVRNLKTIFDGKYSLAVERGSAIADFFISKKIYFQSVSKDIQAIQMLRLNRVDLWGTDLLSGSYKIFFSGIISELSLVYQGFELPIYIGISKTLPKKDRDRIKREFNRLNAKGFFYDLQQDYIHRMKQLLDKVNVEY